MEIIIRPAPDPVGELLLTGQRPRLGPSELASAADRNQAIALDSALDLVQMLLAESAVTIFIRRDGHPQATATQTAAVVAVPLFGLCVAWRPLVRPMARPSVVDIAALSPIAALQGSKAIPEKAARQAIVMEVLRPTDPTRRPKAEMAKADGLQRPEDLLRPAGPTPSAAVAAVEGLLNATLPIFAIRLFSRRQPTPLLLPRLLRLVVVLEVAAISQAGQAA